MSKVSVKLIFVRGKNGLKVDTFPILKKADEQVFQSFLATVYQEGDVKVIIDVPLGKKKQAQLIRFGEEFEGLGEAFTEVIEEVVQAAVNFTLTNHADLE